MLPEMQQIAKKLEHLSPERLVEVEDFIDFLRQRDQDLGLRQDFLKAGESGVAKVWDNDEDTVYDLR